MTGGIQSLKMSKADCHGVGGIFRWILRQAEQGPNHESDLGFHRPAPSHDGLFNPSGRVFVNRQPVVGRGNERRGAGGAHGAGGVHRMV